MELLFLRSAFMAGICLLSFSTSALAGSSRTAITGIPKIQGREIEQFVLMSFVSIKGVPNSGYPQRMPLMLMPDQYVAASEDNGGVYYQSKGGLRLVEDPSQILPGGVYVGKAGSPAMTAYLGDARNQAMPIQLLNHRPLTVEEMKKFQVAKSTAAKAPKK